MVTFAYCIHLQAETIYQIFTHELGVVYIIITNLFACAPPFPEYLLMISNFSIYNFDSRDAFLPHFQTFVYNFSSQPRR